MLYPPHATDDLGFPLNPFCCPRCRSLSRVMNADYLANIIAYDTTPDDRPEIRDEDWTKP